VTGAVLVWRFVLELLVEVVVAVALTVNRLFRLLEVFCKKESWNTYKVPLMLWLPAPTTRCQADRSSTVYLREDIWNGIQNLKREIP
jgi:hypothetical protein